MPELDEDTPRYHVRVIVTDRKTGTIFTEDAETFYADGIGEVASMVGYQVCDAVVG